MVGTHGRFPNLGGLRFLAALAVAVTHVEQVSSIFGLPSLYHFRAVAVLGDAAVSVFFVLSGFLITYLLLKENDYLIAGNARAADRVSTRSAVAMVVSR